MEPREQNEIKISGSEFSDLQILDEKATRTGLWAFLTQVVPTHPWIAGLLAVVGVIAFGDDHSPWVLIFALVSATVITVIPDALGKQNVRKKESS